MIAIDNLMWKLKCLYNRHIMKKYINLGKRNLAFWFFKMKPTLIQTCKLIQQLNENNYESYFKGCGNGNVKVVVEQLRLINCKEVKS